MVRSESRRTTHVFGVIFRIPWFQPFIQIHGAKGVIRSLVTRYLAVGWSNISVMILIGTLIMVLELDFSTISVLVTQFTRITQESVKKQPTRQRIIGILEQNPCLGVTDIMAATNLAEGTVRHHLKILARHSFIKSVLAGRNRYFYVKNSGLSKGQIETLALLRSNKYLAIIKIIDNVPGIDQGKIAENLGISQCQTYVRIQQLLQKGLIRSIKIGRHVTYHRNQIEDSLFSCYLPINFNKRCD